MPINANIISTVTSSRVNSWTSLYYTLRSGAIWYRRERNVVDGYFALDYSEDGGLTWSNLVTEDITEDTNLQDKTHLYRHRIVDYEYRIDQTLTATGYAGAEGVDWENLEVHDG